MFTTNNVVNPSVIRSARPAAYQVIKKKNTLESLIFNKQLERLR